MKLNKSNVIRTHEGGKACAINHTLQLRRSVMSCLLFEKEFYEDGVSIADRIKALVPLVTPTLCGAIALDARHKANLRHVPLLIIREMARLPQHRFLVAELLDRVITRPDQITDFLALYWKDNNGKKTLSAQVKRGLARAFLKFNEYQFAKYDRDAPVKLRDALFLCHAKPSYVVTTGKWTKKERKFYRDSEKDPFVINRCSKILSPRESLYAGIVNRTLETPDTWEVALSFNGIPELDKGEHKRTVFTRLMVENKLGTLAFIRNLRNMYESQIPIELLTDYARQCNVDKILPYQFIAAAKAVPQLEPLLEEMMVRCVADKPKLKGNIILLIDVSGSMDDKLSSKSEMTRLDAACALAILIRELSECVPIIATFSNFYINVPPRKGFALRDAIVQSQGHGGTDLKRALVGINQAVLSKVIPPYDKLIIITDEQSHDGCTAPLGNAKGYIMNVASAKHGVGYGQYTHIDGFSSSMVEYLIEEQNNGY